MSGQTDEPFPGYAEAVHSLGSVAAPLLAGFSVTLVAYTLTETQAFRWPNATLALFTAAALALIGSVQCALNARLYVGGGDDRALQAAHRAWAGRTTGLYNAGVVCLLAGVTVALVPPGALAPARWPAVALAVAGVTAAAAWIGARWLPPR